MTPEQRAAAMRLIDPENTMDTAEWIGEVDALLRELAAEPVQEPIAWLHTVRVCNGDPGETDQALSFSLDSFPLGDAGLFESISAVPLYAAPQQRVPLVDDIVRPLIDDTSEVFFANGSETPQVVRDVIEYVQSWLEAYFDKHGITGEPK